MKRSQGCRGQNNRSNTNAGVYDPPTNQSRDEEEKLLNTGSRMDMFLNVCDVFEKVLDDVEIESCSKQMHDKLLSVQYAIQQKVKPFKLAQFGSNGDLSSSRSLASSVQSVCSVTSEPPLTFEDDLTFKQFLIKVNCPFCSKSQTDKINLIKHLNSCNPFINKTFEKLNFIPYSVFQILPNNTFKCNVCPNSVQRDIKSNFVHARTSYHISAYNKLAVKKVFTEFFFCSSCKILIPNNFTQLDIHINSEVHGSKCLKAIKVETYLEKNIHCLYMKCRKFKCLICLTQSLFSTPKQIISHFDNPRHLKLLEQKHLSLGMIFCEFCSVDVRCFELLSHFTSNKHMFQEKIKNFQETFELCLYCGVLCKNLMELAAHMKANCQEIKKLKKEHPECNKVNTIRRQSTEVEKSDDVMKEKSNNDKKIPEGCKKKRNIIIVKNNTDMSKLLGYFEGFGEIIALEMFREKNVLIEFKEKSAVDEVLMVRDIIKMNDVKLEVTTDEELISQEKAQPKENVRERRVSFRDHGRDSSASEHEREDEEVGSSNDPVNDMFNEEIENTQLRELFQRVSGYLINSTQKFNSDIQRTIFKDCCLTFDGYKCTLVGFAGSGLSFSVESINLYLFRNSVHEPELFILSRKLLLDKSTWVNVTHHDLEPVPYVRAIHRSTKTVCKITKEESAKIVTDILCYYEKENDLVKPFCLIIRFWLSVHELKIREFEYVIMSLLIFFLVNEEVVKPFPNMDTQSLKEAFVFEKLINDKYKLNEDRTKNEDKKTYSVYELFLKFLRFLVKFDFNKHAICVPVKHPIPRDWMHQRQIIEIKGVNQQNNSPMLIWDPLVKVNLAQNVSEKDLKLLLDTATGTIFK